MRAGTSSVDITPDDVRGLNAMGPDFLGVHDRLYVRALVLAGKQDTVAVVSVDLLEVGVTTRLRARVGARTGLPPSAVLIVPTHTHNAPRAGATPAGGLSRAASPESLTFTEFVFDKIVEAVVAARDALEPACLALGRGSVDVNVNRDVLRDGIWTLGQDPDGPSDKTLTVVSVQTPHADTIATLIGYAVHPTAVLGTRLVSADLAGVTMAAVNAALGGQTLWLPGALGDQAVRKSMESLKHAGEESSLDRAFAAVHEQGSVIADEVIRVVRGMTSFASDIDVESRESTLACPPKRGTSLPPDMIQEVVERVDLRLTMMRIGSLALLGVGGEVTTAAASQIRETCGIADSVIVSMANERLGYLADDEAFDRGTFAARGCPITRGWVTRAAERFSEMLTGEVRR